MRRDRVPILVLLTATALGLTWVAPRAWLSLLSDGLLASAVLVAAAGWGAWPAAWLGFRDRSLGQQICLATALGLGLLGIVTLTLGIAGALSRPLAWTLLAIGGAAGLVRLYLAQSNQSQSDAAQCVAPSSDAPPFQGGGLTRSLFLIPLAVPLVITLFGASLPPGMLWLGEANAYDVLEYHLEAPREYFQSGYITFLPYNVYASFPQQVEMLYLLLMHLAGGVYAAAIPAQFLSAGCGILTVIALACWTRPGWSRWLVVLLAGSTPWLAFLGCLAYVENAMLFFTAIAAGLVIDHYRDGGRIGWRTVLTAGLCAGLACGCKYTAVAFVPIALAVAWLLTSPASLKLSLRLVIVFALGSVLTFGPWLIRNAAFTGNPIYPFAYEWFGGTAWSQDQAEEWSTAHDVRPEDDSATGRLTLAARELLGAVATEQSAPQPPYSVKLEKYELEPSLFGQVILLLAAIGIVFGRSRKSMLLVLWSALILAAWIALTFITGRFAVPLIVPLVLLGGEALRPQTVGPEEQQRWTGRQWSILLICVAGALVNDVTLAGRLRWNDQRWTARTDIPMRMLPGQTDVFVEENLLNLTLPRDSYAWLVGQASVFYVDRRIHYTVPFSRDPWLKFAASTSDPDAALQWLRDRHVTHLVFNWSEIQRLRETYGFSGLVTPDWVAQLARAGLKRVELVGSPTAATRLVVYRILPRAVP